MLWKITGSRKIILLLFTYGNWHILWNLRVLRNTTSNKSGRKRKENVSSEVQEESRKNYSVWIRTHSRAHQMLFGICQYRKSQICTCILTSLPSQPIPLLHSISHTFFPPLLNVHPKLSSTYRFKTDGCNKLKGFGWKRKLSVTISAHTNLHTQL